MVLYLCTLKHLLHYCPQCGTKLVPTDIKIKTVGTAACVSVQYPAGHIVEWSSQPKVDQTHLGDIAAVSGTVCSGNTYKYTTLKEIAEGMNLHTVSAPSFYRIRSDVVEPAIHEAAWMPFLFNMQLER